MTVTSDDPDDAIMQIAWRRLWTPGTPYYLPTAILKGAQGNGITVDPLGRLEIADTGPIPLVKSDTWGNISVDLSHALVAGLETLSNGGLIYDSSTTVFSAKLAVGEMTFSGDYDVEGSGLLGCAVSSAGKALSLLDPTRLGPAAAAADRNPDLDLASSYRDQLALSDAGLDQVSTYYENNETLNEVVSGQNGHNPFTVAWPNYEPTPGKNSAYFAAQTSSAAQNPFDPGATVGDTDYSLHAFTMQGILIKVLLGLSTQDGDKYDRAAQATLAFKGLVQTQPSGPVMVGTVMTGLGAKPPGDGGDAVRSAAPADGADGASIATDWSALIERADALVEETYPHWEAEAVKAQARLDAELEASSTGVSGGFSDHFAVPSATISGTVEVVGTSPNTSLQVTISKIDATIPGVRVELSGSGALLDAAQTAIANAGWFQNLLTKNVHDRVNQSDIRNWLTDRVNQSITDALGSFG